MTRILIVCLIATLGGGCARPVVIGAKKQTESIILAEMGRKLVASSDTPARRDDLGGTPALWAALRSGDVDAYVEYTGTITRQILQAETADLNAALEQYGVRMSSSLGFRDNYAIGMRKDVAAGLGIKTISDLRGQPNLRLGFTHEFLDRADGWPGLRQAYGLTQRNVSGFNHALAYRALEEKAIDAIELYTTDGEIAALDLLVLKDDRNFFPAYEAVWLYRADLAERHPQVVAALKRLEGRIDEHSMQELNGAVQEKRASEESAASGFLTRTFGGQWAEAEPSLAQRVLETTREHLVLVVPSLLAAIVVAVPLGIVAARQPRLGQVVLTVTGIVQTIPSLALLLFMIPVCKALVGEGTGPPPAIAALFLYSLLPIVRNTHAGLTAIPAAIRESAEALGLPGASILWRIELPLAAGTIMAGIKTAAVINVGTATLGGFIGAGGYGRPVLRGLDKGDLPLMLEGAIPAAILALVVQGVFGLIERAIKPRAEGVEDVGTM